MKVLITGSAGYIGNLLYRHYQNMGHDVFGIDIRESSSTDLLGSVMNIDSRIFTDIEWDIVFDCAADASINKQSMLEYADNWGIPKRILEHCKLPRTKIVLFSSMLADGNIPSGIRGYFYAESKVKMEHEVSLKSSTNYRIIRPASVWGKNSHVYRWLVLLIRFNILPKSQVLTGKRVLVHEDNLVYYLEKMTNDLVWEKVEKPILLYDNHISYKELTSNLKSYLPKIDFLLLTIVSICDIIEKSTGISMPIGSNRFENLKKDKELLEYNSIRIIGQPLKDYEQLIKEI